MVWRLRATLPDRPGTLAAIAQKCGKAGVNIVGVQIFRGAGAATVELVVEAPDTVAEVDLIDLVHRGGAQDVESMRCTEAALADQPTRYVNAARAVLAQPSSFPDVAAHLFDADLAPTGDHEDVMLGISLLQVTGDAYLSDESIHITAVGSAGRSDKQSLALASAGSWRVFAFALKSRFGRGIAQDGLYLTTGLHDVPRHCVRGCFWVASLDSMQNGSVALNGRLPPRGEVAPIKRGESHRSSVLDGLSQ